MRWLRKRRAGLSVVVAITVGVGMKQVVAQDLFGSAASAAALVQQMPQPFASPTSGYARLEWLVNVLRAMEENGSLGQILRKGIHESDTSIPTSLADALVHALSVPGYGKSHESMDVSSYGGRYEHQDDDKDDYNDDSSDDDSSDEDSSDEDSSDDDSSDDYKHHKHKRHRKKRHHKQHKCKCKKHKKRKKSEDKNDESNVFSKIRGVNIGTTFANIQITGGNATAPETPTPTPTPTAFPGSNLGNFGPSFNGGWGRGALGRFGGVPRVGGFPPGAGAGPGGVASNASAVAVPTSASQNSTREAPSTQAPTTTDAPASVTAEPSATSTNSTPEAPATPDPPANKASGTASDPADPPTPSPTRTRPPARLRFRR